MRGCDANVSRSEWFDLAQMVCKDLNAALEDLVTYKTRPPQRGLFMHVNAKDFTAPDLKGCDGWQLGKQICINPAITSVARRYAIILHEVGHAFGLDHVETKGAVMTLESVGLRGALTEERRAKWCKEIRDAIGASIEAGRGDGRNNAVCRRV